MTLFQNKTIQLQNVYMFHHEIQQSLGHISNVPRHMLSETCNVKTNGSTAERVYN